MEHRPVMMIGCEREAVAALRDALGSVDIPAVTAPDARAALKLLQDAGPPCAIVCDQRMPGLSALAFLARLSLDRWLGEIPAMVVSGGHPPRLVPPNVKAWLGKPYAVEQACVLLIGILGS
jgi:CheY-like chemotaxis protein